MRLRITHDTRYEYEPAVQTALHVAHLVPPHTRCQERAESRLEVDPTPATLTETLDIYRNVRAFFEIDAAHDHLHVRATSLVNTSGNNTLQNITDSDTRGEQYGRDYDEGTFASDPGERPSDFVQEVTPDFHGNGQEDGEPGGPNGSDGPTGGQTTPDGNPGL